MALRMLWIFVVPAAFSSNPSDSYLEPQKATSQLGDRLVLNCGTKRCENPRFSWQARGDKPLLHTSEINPSPTESQLIIHRVTLEHKATIDCTVFCGDKKISRAARVKVYSFPTDPVVSGNGHLWPGAERNLTCVVRDVYPVEKLKVMWVHGETVLKTAAGNRKSMNDATEMHTSIYTYTPNLGDGKKNITCRATLEMEDVPVNQATRQTTVSLTIQSPPRNTTVTVFPSTHVQEGQDVTISCRTDSFLPVRFVLKKNGSHKEIESQDGTFRLQQVTLYDAGLYQVNVSNQLGYSTEHLTINVTAPPRNTTVTVFPSTHVQEGQDVTISCRTDSFLPVRFVLKKDGSHKEIGSQDGTFRLRQVTLYDAGLYQINVSNQLGYSTEQLTLSVTAPPRNTTVTVFPSTHVQEGQDVTISCRTDSFLPVRFVLKKDGSHEEIESQDGTFRLQQVTLYDAGLYQVNVSNQLGYSTEQLTINVTAPPRNTTVTVFPSTHVQEGQDVTISCRTDSFLPVRFVLKKDGSHEEIESQDGTFRLRQVTLYDAGLYQVNVSNQLGYSTEQLTLSVTGHYMVSENNTILPTVLGSTIGMGAMVTTAAFVIRYLRKAKLAGTFELSKDVLSAL